MDEVEILFFTKKKLSKNWGAKCKAFWKEFRDFVEVTDLRDIMQEPIVDYYDMINEVMREEGRHRARRG